LTFSIIEDLFFHQLFVANKATLSKRSKKKAREIILFWN